MTHAGGAATESFVLFSGSSNPALTEAIAHELGVSPGRCHIEHFPDGEIGVRLEESVRGREIFIVQPTSPPVNDHLMELLIIADACRRAAPARITAVIPYFGYSRSDKRNCRREPITASLVSEMIEGAGIEHLVLLDVHTEQMEGFFHGPVDSLTAVPAICRALAGTLDANSVVVSPDAGRVRAATEYARRLEMPLVVLHKRRETGSRTEVTRVVGDVSGRKCLIVDDMISTGGTIAESAIALRAHGAAGDFTVAATHGLLLDGASERMASAGVERVIVTDSIANPGRRCENAQVVTVAPLFAAAIRLELEDICRAAVNHPTRRENA